MKKDKKKKNEKIEIKKSDIGKKEIKIKGEKFRIYNKDYYISKSGKVYSVRSKIFLKHAIDIDGYHRVDIYGKHKKIHRMVYKAWKGDIPKTLQVNHIDDDKDNNHIDNLYLGTQKDNIRDQFRNKTRVGNMFVLSILDKYEFDVYRFFPPRKIYDFLNVDRNKLSIKELINSKWFIKRYLVLEYRRIRSKSDAESVTTMCDECNTVG